MPTERRKKGDLGERLAEEYLKRKGYSIIGKNYLKRGGEIDIIASDPADGRGTGRGRFVFVEVKSRYSAAFGCPAEAATPRKLKKIENTARLYLAERGRDADDFQIDVIGIEIDVSSKSAKLKHFKAVSGS